MLSRSQPPRVPTWSKNSTQKITHTKSLIAMISIWTPRAPRLGGHLGEGVAARLPRGPHGVSPEVDTPVAP